MRLTKIDGIYHSKEKLTDDKTIGKLINKSREGIRAIVENRFLVQIESRIYKEFFTLKGNRINKENEFFELFLFLKKLYLNTINKEESLKIAINIENLLKIDIEALENNNKIIRRYKLNKDNYLVKLESGIKSKSFLEMFTDVQNDIKAGVTLIESSSYKELQKIFDVYVNRKIDYIVKSLENNKIFVKNKNKNLEIMEDNFKTKFYFELIEKCKKESNKDLFEEEINRFLIEVNNQVKEIVEALNNENLDVMKKRKKVLEIVRSTSPEIETKYNYEGTWIRLLKEELKLIVINVTSISKKEFKERNGKSGENLTAYFNYLKKELGSEDKLNIKIKENFKNRFVSRILEYGKYLHYLKDRAVTSKELEFIKAKESLNSKIATIISFAIHTYNKLSKDNISYEFLREKTGEKFDICDVNNIDFRKIGYFFNDVEDYSAEEKEFFMKALQKSLYNYRLQVAHFNRENKVHSEIGIEKYKDSKKMTFDEKDTKVTYNYLNSIEEEIEENLKKKFNSNNLEFYYDAKEIEKYFNIYQYKLLKTKVPYAPNFKRMIEKGEKLYQHNNKRYKYFFIFKDETTYTEEEKKAYLDTKNYLLKELYYNNFFKEFLNESNEYFLEAVKNTKKRKSSNNKKGKKSGVAYKQFEEYKKGDSISEYIANIHKLEINKLADEKYIDSKKKEKSKYINEYLEDIFLEGFISWLDEIELMFLSDKKKIEKKDEKIETEYKIKLKTELKIDKENKKELMIFLILSLVDDKRISEFSNELVKYNQYLEKRTEGETKFFEIDIDTWRKICELILLTRERLSLKESDIKRSEKGENNHLIKKYYGENDNYFKVISKFIEEDILEESKNIRDENKLLYHNTDGKTPILYGNLEKTRKFGLNNLIDNIEYKKYSKIEREDYKKEEIEELQKKKAELHLKWEKKEKIDLKEYECICTKIRRYDYLRKKQTMYIPFLLHEIASDIQARFLGYIVKQERDFKFFKLVFGISEKKYIDEVYENKFLANTFKREVYDEIRNYIAHFHHYIDMNESGEKTKYSFIEQMNLLIKFLGYNKKIKNHINKSIKTILEKYNMEITFKRVDKKDGSYEYVINTISSKKGKILGENNKFEILEKEFVEEVRKILEYRGK